MGVVTQGLMGALKSINFVQFIENMTGIPNLLVDPTNEGGGQHQTFRGGSLQIHADFNTKDNHVWRRVNILLFTNEGWEDEWGGSLELWNRSMSHCQVRAMPLSNRLIVFSNTDYSYHGHADPLKCPPSRSRRSIAMYYYSLEPPPDKDRIADHSKHSTLYQHRNCASQQCAVCTESM